MNTLKEQFTQKFEEYLKTMQISQGTEPNSVDHILKSFQSFAPTIPATKAMLGRALSKKFLKKQHYVFADQTLSQCYYFNKSV